MASYKDLLVWQKSFLLAKEIYLLGQKLPKQEIFGLISQIQRSAVSIPSNLAEGYGRSHRKEFIQFVSISYGSATELETQILLIQDIYQNIDCGLVLEHIVEVQKMLIGLLKKLRVNSS